ncbi:MAG: hypothetical protein U0704_09495 [Candidatus Eisenbacteria bacterium]
MRALVMVACVLVLSFVTAQAAPRPAPDARALFAHARRHIGVEEVKGVRTVAEVSEGGRHWVTTVTSAMDGRALFEQGDDFRAGVDSLGAWTWNAGERQRANADSRTAAAVRGHELHLLAWDPLARWRIAGPPRDTVFGGRRAWLTPMQDERGAAVAIFHAAADTLPLGFVLPDESARDGSRIEVEWLDWRTEHGARWFRRAVFHQGGRSYVHDFREVGCIEPRHEWFAADPGEGARPVLLALHERVLEAHRRSDVEGVLADEGDGYTLANRGELAHPTLAERRSRMGPYLQRTRFRRYSDLTAPVVSVSPDGRQGWVIVQVEAEGTQVRDGGGEAELKFVSAWIELYERRDGRWWRTGNVSNFRP